MSATYDPFVAPSTPYGVATEDFYPASLGDRLVARIVDNIAGIATFVPAGLAVLAVGGPEAMEQSPTAMAIVTVAAVVSLVLLIGFAVLQWVWLSTRGQSVGKRVVGIHIVKLDGSPADFVSAVVLRSWIPGVVMGVANQVCLGWLVSLIDIAPIFGQDRRCIHDYIAGTKVAAGMPTHLDA